MELKDKTFLFEENRSGEFMGKPGDANNVYYAHWCKYYTFGESGRPLDDLKEG